jgi:hypothetical protein
VCLQFAGGDVMGESEDAIAAEAEPGECVLGADGSRVRDSACSPRSRSSRYASTGISASWCSGGPSRNTCGAFVAGRAARARRDAIAVELAARRMPDLRSLEVTAPRSPTLVEAGKRWQASRVDVTPATATYQRSAFNRAKSLHGRRVNEVTLGDVAGVVAELQAAGLSRETIR